MYLVRHMRGTASELGLRKIWQVGFIAERNVGGSIRLDTGRHDPSNKTRPDKPEVSS